MFQLKQKFERLNKKQLRRLMWLFFLSLFIPSTLLIYKAFSQLKWEVFHQHRQQAEEFSNRFDTNLSRLVDIEEKRSFTDYSFLNIAGDLSSNVLLRSPLSSFPVKSQIPGLLGYFQIDTDGNFSTTLLPVDSPASIYGISKPEFEQRTFLQEKLFHILSENKLVTRKPAALPSISSLDDEIESRRQVELDRNNRRQKKKVESPAREKSEKLEQNRNDEPVEIASTVSISLDQEQVEEQLAEVEQELGASGRIIADGYGDTKESVSAEDSALYSRALPSSPQAQNAFDKLKKSNKITKSKKAFQSPSAVIFNKEQFYEEDEGGLLTPEKEPLLDGLSVSNEFAYEKKLVDKQQSVNEELDDDRISISGSRLRSEKNYLPEQKSNDTLGKKDRDIAQKAEYRVEIFQSEIDLFELSLLDSGHFVLFRKVWRNDHRYIQGALIEPSVLFNELLERDFRKTSLSEVSHLSVSYEQKELSRYLATTSTSTSYSSRRSNELKGEVLYQSRLSAPFSSLEFFFTVEDLTAGSGDQLIIWVSVLILVVICLGIYLMYQLASRQIDLLSQQQDFVSSVSHELKTPLTSIRMYGEMLLEGWVSETKKTEYYRYIHDESERLSRLINNVLQLSKMSRDDLQITLQPHTISVLTDHIKSKISSQLDSAGFDLVLDCDASLLDKSLQIDLDAFTQVIINLVDNAIKFSQSGKTHQIEIHCKLKGTSQIQFSVRDFGKGIDKQQMKKIFKLFYRVENELTRETIGTGIGLALVQKLVTAMNGDVDVINKSPGAEFRITFPLAKNTTK